MRDRGRRPKHMAGRRPDRPTAADRPAQVEGPVEGRPAAGDQPGEADEAPAPGPPTAAGRWSGSEPPAAGQPGAADENPALGRTTAADPPGQAEAPAPDRPTATDQPGAADEAPAPGQAEAPAPGQAEAPATNRPTAAEQAAADRPGVDGPARPSDAGAGAAAAPATPSPAGTTGPPTQGEAPTDAPRGRGRLRWALPAALALVVAGAGGAAVALSADDPGTPVGVDLAAATPVLSARRVPEVIAAPVADRRLAGDLRSWLGASPPDTCLVVASQGREVFGHNPALPVTGASTHKLLTATGLLLAYGPDHRFTTTASAAAAPRDGVIAGDLYLVGGGPADLGTPDWPQMSPGTRPRVVHDIGALADAIVAAGVTHIEGGVVGDGTRYDDQRYEPTIARRLIDQDQVGPIGGLMVNDGFGRFGPDRSNAGTVPAGDPAADAAKVLSMQLVTRGVTVAGPPRAGPGPDDATAVATLDSPPLSQLVGEMLTTSDNEAAEAGIKEIGVATGGQGSWAAGAAGLTSLLQEAGVPVDGLRVVDGSGLSIEDRFTCTTLVDVLTRDATGPVVRAGLPIAGETGTLAERYDGTPLAGRLRAKTGTLRNVTALAGEIEALQGGALTFAYVANVPDPGEVDAGEVGVERLGEILLAYPRGIDLAALEPRAPVSATGSGPG